MQTPRRAVPALLKELADLRVIGGQLFQCRFVGLDWRGSGPDLLDSHFAVLRRKEENHTFIQIVKRVVDREAIHAAGYVFEDDGVQLRGDIAGEFDLAFIRGATEIGSSPGISLWPESAVRIDPKHECGGIIP